MSARPDLCGGQSAMVVPTAISQPVGSCPGARSGVVVGVIGYINNRLVSPPMGYGETCFSGASLVPDDTRCGKLMSCLIGCGPKPDRDARCAIVIAQAVMHVAAKACLTRHSASYPQYFDLDTNRLGRRLMPLSRTPLTLLLRGFDGARHAIITSPSDKCIRGSLRRYWRISLACLRNLSRAIPRASVSPSPSQEPTTTGAFFTTIWG